MSEFKTTQQAISVEIKTPICTPDGRGERQASLAVSIAATNI